MEQKRRSERIHGYDVIRGFSVISMVLFHLCYDLVYLYGVGLGWFTSPLQDVWRASISWTFLLVAGIMCSYSSSNVRRAAKYLAVAGVVFVATTVAAVDTPVNFGIIYCMGFSTLVGHLYLKLASRAGVRVNVALALALALFFVICLDVPTGTFGLATFGGPYFKVPAAPYAYEWLSWLGFPGPHFASGDYYPPLPFSLLFLAGTSLGVVIKAKGAPRALQSLRCQPLEYVGRHALPIYVIHQPLILGVLKLVYGY